MTTLAAGSSTSITVGDGGRVSVASNGGFWTADVTRTEQGITRSHRYGPSPVRHTFGPYGEGATVVLTAGSADLAYDAFVVGSGSSDIAAGGSSNLTVAAGGSLTLASNSGFWSATVTAPGESARVLQFGPRQVRTALGPFPNGASVTVASSSAAIACNQFTPGDAAPTSLVAFRTALSNRDNANVRIVVVGDSWSSDWQVSAADKSWINRWQDKLRAAYPTAGIGSGGGLGYRPFRKQSPAAPYVEPWTLTGTTEILYFGLGLNGCQFGGTHKAVMTVTGTSALLHFAKSTAAAGMYYKVDGGSQVNFSVGSFAVGGDDGEFSIPLGASGSHTLEIGYQSGAGGCFAHGCVFYNGDESKGITVMAAGHASYGSSNFITPASGAASHNMRVGKVNPHLLVIMLGINEFVGASTKLTPAQYKANILTMISAYRAAGFTGSVLLLREGDVTLAMSAGNNPLAPWVQYFPVLQEIAAADPTNISAFDLSAAGRVPPSPSTSGGGLWVDNLHLGDVGHELIADLAMQAVAP